MFTVPLLFSWDRSFQVVADSVLVSTPFDEGYYRRVPVFKLTSIYWDYRM